MDLLIAIALLIICYFTGRSREKKHYKSIREREEKLYKQPHINFSKNVNVSKPVKNAKLVSASVVIGCDYFKVFLASLRYSKKNRKTPELIMHYNPVSFSINCTQHIFAKLFILFFCTFDFSCYGFKLRRKMRY